MTFPTGFYVLISLGDYRDTAETASRSRVLDKRADGAVPASTAESARRYRPGQLHQVLAGPARGAAGRRELLRWHRGRQPAPHLQ